MNWYHLYQINCIKSFLLGYCEGYLLVYSETHIDVFDCTTGDWLQTLNVKRARPLNTSGSLTTCAINDMPHVIFLSNLHQRKFYRKKFSTELYEMNIHGYFYIIFRWTIKFVTNGYKRKANDATEEKILVEGRKQSSSSYWSSIENDIGAYEFQSHQSHGTWKWDSGMSLPLTINSDFIFRVATKF